MGSASRRGPFWLFLLTLCIAAALWMNSSTRWRLRWWFSSRSYKASTLSQPDSGNQDFKHVEWDAWGWGGADTVVYLVFDPTDALDAAAKEGRPGKYSGIPCEVFRVRKMQHQWYIVEYYTDSTWEDCHS